MRFAIVLLSLLALAVQAQERDPEPTYMVEQPEQAAPARGKRLAKPKRVLARAAEEAVVLSWKPVTGAESYLVYWVEGTVDNGKKGKRRKEKKPNVDPKDPRTQRLYTDRPESEFTHEWLIPGETYFYRVAGIDAKGTAGRVSKRVFATAGEGSVGLEDRGP